VLVVIGVNARGQKHFLAIEDGVRESTQSWREVLLALKHRGLSAPKLATGDGAMGFWAALEEVFPTTPQQRCWMHKTGNVLNCLPKRTQPKAKKALHDIWQAETREEAHTAFDLFIETYEAKYPKAAQCLIKGPRRIADLLRLPGPALAEHPHIKSDRKRLRHNPAPDKANQRMSQPRRHAPHDVQAGPERRKKLAKTARLRSSRRRHQRRRFRKRHQAIKPRSSRRMMSAWTPDLTIAQVALA
jgi:transposase-like protein